MATLKYIINKKSNKNGKHYIYLRLTHKRKPTSIKTGIEVLLDEWDSKTEKIKKIKNGTPNIVKLNFKLSKFSIRISEAIDKIESEGKLHLLNVTQLRKIVMGNQEKESVFNFWERFINEIKHFKSLNTKIAYECSFKSFKKFRKNEDLFFEELDYSILCKYKKWFIDKNVTTNGYRGKLTNLKTIFYEAKKHKIFTNELDPFLHFTIEKTPPKKKALTKEEMERIIHYKVDENSYLGKAKNIFLISYYACGIPFVDLVKLKYENIDNNFIQYNRSKTKTAITIPLIPKLKVLLEKHLALNSNKEYIFPFITTEEPKKFRKQYLVAQRHYNYSLSVLGEKCGLKKKLTPYKSRHTAATLMINEYKIPIHIVAALFGHSSTRMTETYVDSIDKSQLSNYLKVI